MLSIRTVTEVRRLIAEGELTQRQIAARLQISQASITNIENGRSTGKSIERTRLDQKQDMRLVNRPYKRCPDCGGMAQLGETGKCLECDLMLESQVRRVVRQVRQPAEQR